jgi:hypothetical protein
MKTLIVYYSYTANNEKLAHFIRQLLDCDILRIEDLRPRSAVTILFDVIFHRHSAIKPYACTLKDYDRVILVAPIWDARIASPMATFLRKEKDNISHYSFVTLCGGRADQVVKVRRQLMGLAGKSPADVLELCVNDLLPPEKKNKIRYVTPYRVNESELAVYRPQIDRFLNVNQFF